MESFLEKIHFIYREWDGTISQTWILGTYVQFQNLLQHLYTTTATASLVLDLLGCIFLIFYIFRVFCYCLLISNRIHLLKIYTPCYFISQYLRHVSAHRVIIKETNTREHIMNLHLHKRPLHMFLFVHRMHRT